MNLFINKLSKSTDALSNNCAVHDNPFPQDGVTDRSAVSRIAVQSALPFVRDYMRRGWYVLPLAPRTKNPLGGWEWAKAAVTENLVEPTFSQTKNNIGVALGERSDGLIDVDLDWPEARIIADHLVGEWPAFGRASAPRSHRLAICRDRDLRTTKFTVPLDKNNPRLPPEHGCCVTELRGNGSYTMFPGSVHPSGEQVYWEGSLDQIPEISSQQLEGTVGLTAFLAVALRFYPAKGSRDEICMALTGALLRCAYLDAETRVDAVDRLVCFVARLANDEEYRTRGKAKATWEKMQQGTPVTGVPRLVELLGLPKECGRNLGKWIGLRTGSRWASGYQPKPRSYTATRSSRSRLESAGTPIFQRGGHLVRVVRQDYQNLPGVQNLHVGPLNITDVNTTG